MIRFKISKEVSIEQNNGEPSLFRMNFEGVEN